jgi:2-methylcitrate dehydratase
MKAFPSEALTHSHLSATLKVVKENDIKPENIDEVRITTIARAVDILFDPEKYHPSSRETADHSLPYCVATAIVDRKITTESFSEEKLKDERIWNVINKIKGEASEEFEKMFPEKQPSRVTIRLTNGQEYTAYLEYPKGDPREPMTMEDLENKFNALSYRLLSKSRQGEIKNAIFSLEDFSNISDFMKKLIA